MLDERRVEVNLKTKGNLIVISGPSGVGKGTIVRRVLKDLTNVALSISATTRTPRQQEKDGVHYYFLSEDKFVEMIKNDGFLEYTKYNHNYYGTPKEKVYEILNQGKDIILEIDVKGAVDVKKKYKDAIMIFVMPPSVDSLYHRLLSRNTESKEEIQNRIKRAREEMQLANKYDYVVINGSLRKATDKVKSIILSL